MGGAARVRPSSRTVCGWTAASYRAGGGWVRPGRCRAPNGPAAPLVCLQFDRRPAEVERGSAITADVTVELQNGDRMVGVICGFVPAAAKDDQAKPAQLIVRLPWAPQDPNQAVAVNTDWIRRIVFDPRCATGPARRTLVRRGCLAPSARFAGGRTA